MRRTSGNSGLSALFFFFFSARRWAVVYASVLSKRDSRKKPFQDHLAWSPIFFLLYSYYPFSQHLNPILWLLSPWENGLQWPHGEERLPIMHRWGTCIVVLDHLNYGTDYAFNRGGPMATLTWMTFLMGVSACVHALKNRREWVPSILLPATTQSACGCVQMMDEEKSFNYMIMNRGHASVSAAMAWKKGVKAAKLANGSKISHVHSCNLKIIQDLGNRSPLPIYSLIGKVREREGDANNLRA